MPITRGELADLTLFMIADGSYTPSDIKAEIAKYVIVD